MTAEAGRPPALYWDASSILSLITRDRHVDRAEAALLHPGPHLLSSLAFAEVCAVLARLERERRITSEAVGQATVTLQGTPWFALHLQPDRDLAAQLCRKYSLRGADLWHLATWATLSRELSGVGMVSFDERLAAAAEGEMNLG